MDVVSCNKTKNKIINFIYELCKANFFSQKIRVNYGSGWVQVSLKKMYWKSSHNRPKPVLIVLSSIPSVLKCKKKKKNHGLLQSNKYNDFVLSWRNNATTSRHQRRQCVGRRRIRDGVPSLESRAFYRSATPRPQFCLYYTLLIVIMI